MFFKGLDNDQNGTFPLPEKIVKELLYEISTLAELKVTLFIARLTCGHSNKFIRISINQFINGIEDENGNLISKGVGLARQHVIRGIRLAEERGTILVYTTGPKGKQVKWYFWNTKENKKLVEALRQKHISINELVKSRTSLF